MHFEMLTNQIKKKGLITVNEILFLSMCFYFLHILYQGTVCHVIIILFFLLLFKCFVHASSCGHFSSTIKNFVALQPSHFTDLSTHTMRKSLSEEPGQTADDMKSPRPSPVECISCNQPAS